MNTPLSQPPAKLSVALLVMSLLAVHHAVAAPPQATTRQPTNLTATGAVLASQIVPGGAATTTWFEWGAGDILTHSTPPVSVGAGTAATNFSQAIAGLAAGIPYQCRAVASNSTGTIRGRTVTFGTPALLLNGANPLAIPLDATFADPGAVPSSAPWALHAGDQHNVVLKADGRLAGWGSIEQLQIAFSNAPTDFMAMATGGYHTLAVRTNGRTVGFGENTDGQITIPSTATNAVASVAAGGYHSLALKTNGTVVAWGANWDGQKNVPSNATNVIALAAGRSHSLALRADGTVVGWGGVNSPYNPALVPDEATNIVSLAAGGDQSAAVRLDGSLVTWGWNNDGQIEVPAEATNLAAIALGYTHWLALRRDGSVIAWGQDDNETGKLDVPPEATNIIAIAAGLDHSVALRQDGTIISWGTISATVQEDMPTDLAVLNLPVATAGTVNTSVAGAYLLTYSATNLLRYVGSANRSVLVAYIPPPVIGSISTQTGGSYQLIFDYTTNSTCSILASTNIDLPATNWTVLGQAIESPAGHFEFTDPEAPNFPRRFYRVRVP